MALGSAVETSAGRLPFRAIIHVAGIDDLWRGSERSIRASVRNAAELALTRGYRKVAFPVLGSGSGGFDEAKALEIMLDEFAGLTGDLAITVVRYRR
jgi:O-acetyl-ADP-ribose deacetylase (regulator of RNase III)